MDRRCPNTLELRASIAALLSRSCCVLSRYGFFLMFGIALVIAGVAYGLLISAFKAIFVMPFEERAETEKRAENGQIGSIVPTKLWFSLKTLKSLCPIGIAVPTKSPSSVKTPELPCPIGSTAPTKSPSSLKTPELPCPIGSTAPTKSPSSLKTLELPCPQKILFCCPHCGRHVEIDKDRVGMQTNCPACSHEIAIPRSSPQTTEDSGRMQKTEDGIP